MKTSNFRVLLVSASPFNSSTQSRMFDSFFGNFKKEDIAQFFSRNITPSFEKCNNFFCISDEMILSKRFRLKNGLGIEFNLKNQPITRTESKIRKISQNKTGFRYFLRQLLWGNKIWKTEKFLKWVKAFNPDFILLSVADDFYLNNIALYISKSLKVPLILNIVDDYYFNHKKSVSPFYIWYITKYKNHIKELFENSSGVIYLSNKIKEKYENEFKLINEVIPIPPLVKESNSFPLKTIKNLIYYGSLEPGRYTVIRDFAKSCLKNNIDITISIFSSENRKKILNILQNTPNIYVKGFLNTSDLANEIQKYDGIILAESMRKKDLLYNRLALSTKTTDALCYAKPIIFIGPQESGCYSFIKDFDSSIKFLLSKADLRAINSDYFKFSTEELEQITNRSNYIKSHYTIDYSNELFTSFLEKIASNHIHDN